MVALCQHSKTKHILFHADAAVDNARQVRIGDPAIRKHISRASTYVTGAGLGPLLVRSVTGTAAVRLSAMVASFAVGVQLARVLGVSGYGYYGMAVAVITLAGIPGEMGLPRLVTREVAAAKARGDLAVLFGVLRWADRTARPELEGGLR